MNERLRDNINWLIEDLVYQIKCLRNRLRVVDGDRRIVIEADMLMIAFSIRKAKYIRREFESLRRDL